MKNKKTVLLYPTTQKWHSLYNPIIKALEKRYNVIYQPIENKKVFLEKFKGIPFFRRFYHRFIRRFLSLKDFYRIQGDVKEKYDLVFCSNIIPPFKCKYILDLEFVSALNGYDYSRLNKGEIKKSLEGEDCKKIICWNNTSYDTLVKTIDCSNFLNKITIIPFGIKSQKIYKDFEKKELNLLFVSSTNNPQDFELKGGILALEAYSILSKRYPPTKLYVRANIPARIKKIYSNPNIIFLEEKLSDSEMEKLFLKSDILLEPVPGINLMLECMTFMIPMIAFDAWIIPEMIIENKNGFLIDSSYIFGDIKDMENYLANLHLNYLKLYDSKLLMKSLGKFVEKTAILIENAKSRKKMALYSKALVSNSGKYSLDNRNKKMFKVIVDALQ